MNFLVFSCGIRKKSIISIVDAQNYEAALNPSRFDVVQYQLNKAKYLETQSVYYSERMPADVAPAVPARDLQLVACGTSVSDDNENHYYSTLEEMRGKRMA